MAHHLRCSHFRTDISANLSSFFSRGMESSIISLTCGTSIKTLTSLRHSGQDILLLVLLSSKSHWYRNLLVIENRSKSVVITLQMQWRQNMWLHPITTGLINFKRQTLQFILKMINLKIYTESFKISFNLIVVNNHNFKYQFYKLFFSSFITDLILLSGVQ